MSNRQLKFILILFLVFAFCLAENGVFGFGAGNIPSFAYMEGKAFRHGDIEDTLSTLAKRGGGGFALANLIGKSKFGGLDIKRIYFGNWLRDYSQAVDIAGLKKLQLQTIINLCMALGFVAHGYATHEFEVTEERLGVYLPAEHIDNPKGYGDGEDARQYHPKLRPPVEPIELEVDPRTGMKNYIANEDGHWETSKALVRRTLEQCIHLGRQHRAQGRKQDEYEAYRLLGTALHTLEDFPAHSNFCELALVSMGHSQVFTHVGDQVRLQAQNGKWVAPLVTGTFGSSDFVHSLLGEASDHLSEASVTDLNAKLDKARSTATRSGPGDPSSSPGDAVRDLLFKLPGSDGQEMSREMESIDRIRAGPAQGGKKPEDLSPQELHAVLWQVLTFRDSVVKKIEKTIEKIPGLGPLIEKLMESISVFVFTTLEPYVKPLLQTATTGLMSASTEVIDTHDQYEVFNDPRASDPTHSFLSKDHFNLLLNEGAGQIAKVVLIHTVTWVTKAWDNPNVNVRECTEDILQCLFHPDFHNPNSKVQREMLEVMTKWVQGLGAKQYEVLQRLSKEAVRNHTNIRLAGEGGAPAADGGYAQSQGYQVQASIQSNIQGAFNRIPGAPNLFGHSGGIPGMSREGPDGPPQSAYGYPTDPHSQSSYAPPPGPPQSSYALPPGPPQSSYGPPSEPSLGSYGPPSHSPYGAPPGPPSFDNQGGFRSLPTEVPPAHAGYAPAYAGQAPPAQYVPPSSAPTQSFPGFPDPSGYSAGGGGGYAPPPPSGFGFPGAEYSAQQYPTGHGGPPGNQPPGGPPYQYGGAQGGW